MITKKEFVAWVKVHKRELIISGISIVSILLVIAGISQQDKLEELFLSLCDKSSSIPKDNGATVTPICRAFSDSANSGCVRISSEFDCDSSAYTVSRHIRELPKGWHASADKIKMAQEYGISLHPGQTWVDEYTKCS